MYKMPNTDIKKLSTAIDMSFLVEFSVFSKNSAIFEVLNF